MEKVDNLIEELDIELENLEKLIDVIDDENSLIELRIINSMIIL